MTGRQTWGMLSLALADEGFLPHSISMTTFVIMLALSLQSSPPTPYHSIDLLLEGSFVAGYLSLPAGREVASVGLWEGWREFKRHCFCLSKQLLLLLKQNSIYVANCNSEVLCNTRRTLPEEKDSFHSSCLNHLLPPPMKPASRCL